MKWIGIAFLVPLALILLLSVLLYFPPIQDFARNKIVAYASTSTGIDIRIAKVRLSFPLNLTIQDVLALRAPADTLLKLQSLEVRVKLLPLLKSKVVVDAVDLKGGQIHSGDFIEGLQIDGQLGRFHAKADHIDLTKEMATLNSMELSDTQLSIRMDSVAEEKDSTSAPLNWKIALDKLEKLDDAKKIKVVMEHNGTTVSQTLELNSYNSENAEYGLRSEKLQLASGTYTVIGFYLYDAVDEELLASSAGETFTVVGGGLEVQNLMVETVEALVRWECENRFINPEKFISVAETIGVMRQLGNYILETSIRQLSILNERYDRNLKMTINASVKQFNIDFSDKLAQVMAKYNVDPHNLPSSVRPGLKRHRPRPASLPA
jgi:hypothetical protein